MNRHATGRLPRGLTFTEIVIREYSRVLMQLRLRMLIHPLHLFEKIKIQTTQKENYFFKIEKKEREFVFRNNTPLRMVAAARKALERIKSKDEYASSGSKSFAYARAYMCQNRRQNSILFESE